MGVLVMAVSNKSTTEHYEKTISVEFEAFPPVKLLTVSMKDDATPLQRLAEATRRRFFTLRDAWEVTLDKIDYEPKLNGVVTIPREVDGKEVVFDGASVPFPWLISFLTIGILRPLGVVLTASIVHDFAFKYGYLRVKKGPDTFEKVTIQRHNADRLFRDIISTVNGLSNVGLVAWFFVRLGWFTVKYDGKRWGGTPPFVQTFLFLFILITFGSLFLLFPKATVLSLVVLYMAFYLLTIYIIHYDSGRIES